MRDRKRIKGVVVCLMAASLLALGSTTALGFDAESYFKGKTIRFVTGSRPGGGTDTLLRYMASNWGKFFPGNPRFIVSNLPPHVHGLNYVWHAKPDGTTVFMHSTSILREQVLDQAEFKSSEFRYVGDIGARAFVMTAYDVEYDTIRDAIGSDGPPLVYFDMIPSPADMHPQAFQLMLLAEWLDIPMKFGVMAERGTSITLLEMERGNMNVMIGGGGRWFGLPKLRPGWLEEGKLKPLLDMTYFGKRMAPNAEFTDIEEVPHVSEFLNDEQREIWTALIEAPQAMNKPIVLSPDTPDNILAVYRKALADAMADPQFRAGIEKVTGFPPVYVPGKEAQEEAREAERLWAKYREEEEELRQQMYDKYVRK